MSRIVSQDPPGPGRPDNQPFVATLAPVSCKPWCAQADGHPGAIREAEQACVGVELRLDTTLGGGNGDDQASNSFATLVTRAQQVPGQAPTFLVGIAVGDTEVFIEMGAAELAMLVEYANIHLRQTTRQPETART